MTRSAPQASKAKHVLVAGISSRLGRSVALELLRRGHRVRGLSRKPLSDLPSSVEHFSFDCLRAEPTEACQGISHVFSCIGASVQPDLRLGRASFPRFDLPANLNLLRAAENTGVAHFTYVSVAGAESTRHLAYVDAHERVAEAIQSSKLEACIVRPTGFFSALEAMLPMAKRGLVPLMGDGSAVTNPIADEDLASVCVDGIEGAFSEREVGGPETLSRRRIAELAFEAWDKAPRTPSLPVFFTKLSGFMLRPLNPRVADLMHFYAHVMTHDCVAESAGQRSLANHFRAKAQSMIKALPAPSKS
ncbi:MAG: SDR family oxidoreductase [Polyangiaceae bacterium]